MSKKISSIQTWAGMSVALCSDGTIWEACPIFCGQTDEAGQLVRRLAKMNWRRVADGNDINEKPVQEDAQELPGVMKGPYPAGLRSATEISHLRPMETTEGRSEEYLKQREVAAQEEKLKEMMREPFERNAPPWYRSLELRANQVGPFENSMATRMATRMAMQDRVMLMEKFREAMSALFAISENGYDQRYATECLKAFGFKNN